MALAAGRNVSMKIDFPTATSRGMLPERRVHTFFNYNVIRTPIQPALGAPGDTKRGSSNASPSTSSG
jgi:hypothetical protein